jgi:DNA cross-link repair 1C protein
VRCNFSMPQHAVTVDRFLVEGPDGAVLHTGDMRAEPTHLDKLVRHPRLKKYLAPTSRSSNRSGDILTRIYLDTACTFSDAKLPSKVCCLCMCP